MVCLRDEKRGEGQRERKGSGAMINSSEAHFFNLLQFFLLWVAVPPPLLPLTHLATKHKSHLIRGVAIPT